MSAEPIRVLLLGEDAGGTRVVRDVLAGAGNGDLLVEHARSLERGLQLLAAGGLDVVLLDLPLPEGDGLEALDLLRSRAPRLPVVVLTPHDDDSHMEIVRRGADDVLAKGGMTARQTARAIRHAVERQHSILALRDELDERAKEQTRDLALLQEKSQEQSRALALLEGIDQLLVSTLDEGSVCAEITRRCVEVFSADSCLLRLVEDERLVVKECHFREQRERKALLLLLEETPLRVGEGIAGRVAQTGVPSFSGNEPVESLTLTPFANYLRQRHWIVVPMTAKGQIIGVLTVITQRHGQPFGERDRALVQAVANQAAVAILNARLFGETRLAEAALQQRMSELSALFEVSTSLRGVETLDEMLPIILEKTLDVLHADTGTLCRRSEETGRMTTQAARGRLAALLDHDCSPSGSVCEEVSRTRAPYRFGDLATDPHTGPAYRQFVEGVRGGFCVPLLAGEQIMGTILVGSDTPRVFTDEEVRLLSAIADMGAAAIRRTSLFEELRHRVRELSILFDVGSAITSPLRLGAVADLVVTAASRALHAEGCVLFLWDERRQRLVQRAAAGVSSELIGVLEYRSGEGLAGWVFLERRFADVPDVSADARWKREPARERAFPSGRVSNALMVPLLMAERALGVLAVVNKTGAPAFTKSDQSLLTALAGQVAIAIENARLYEDVRGLSVATIRSLVTAIDARDPYTRGHSEGVTRLAVRLAQELGWTGADLEMLEYAGLLHDAGKIAVPDAILRKPDPLTPQEWDVVRLHPYYSAQIVKPVGALQGIVPWIYHHHERWDGSGYPDKLSGDRIPLGARILAVADAFDAMATDRPYRKALPRTEIFDEVSRCAGSQFDASVVSAFTIVVERSGR